MARKALGSAPSDPKDTATKGYVDTEDTASRARANHTGTQASSTISDVADFYPIGTIYTNETNSANPSTYLPGQSGSTWVAKTDVMIMARGSTYTTAGGAATHTHPLSSDGQAQIEITDSGNSLIRQVTTDSWDTNSRGDASTNSNTTGRTNGAALAGDTDAGSTLPPFDVAYVWKRTA